MRTIRIDWLAVIYGIVGGSIIQTGTDSFLYGAICSVGISLLFKILHDEQRKKKVKP